MQHTSLQIKIKTALNQLEKLNRFSVQWSCDVIGFQPIRTSPPVPFTNVVEYLLAWGGIT
jgi:hypothetical protein